MKILTLKEAALAWVQGKRVQGYTPDGEWVDVNPVGEWKAGRFSSAVFNGGTCKQFRLAEPEVGTAEWANSLPEGTNVRWKGNGWTPGKFTEKRNGVWSKWSGHSYTPDEQKTGWELYTEPTYAPWKADEVPVGAQMRNKGGAAYRSNILGVVQDGDDGDCFIITVLNDKHPELGSETAKDTLLYREHSIDGGKTWHPCGVQEVGK